MTSDNMLNQQGEVRRTELSSITSASARAAVETVQSKLNERIVGQEDLVRRLIIALLADGHLLVEGAPGLAKTTSIKQLAILIEGDFHRLQFTPDLLPGDLTGTDVYRPQTGDFAFQRGPLFHNLILADEINRAPAKVQSALLEAMGERQITVGSTTYHLPRPFLVMATQNPIEQEGTYPLPEAQLDRFLMHVRIGYPELTSERKILELARREATETLTGEAKEEAPVLTSAAVRRAQSEVLAMHLAPAVEEYLVQLVLATRDPTPYGADMADWVDYGASPRATIALDRCARSHAWLAGREYVSPEDVQAIAPDVLRHRVILNFEAEADGITADDFIAALLANLPVS